ncbi:hypothetical protein ACSBR2_008294 [Camellia fascicularis]
MFGLVSQPRCPLCQAPEENHSPLFFRCIYSSRIWAAIQAKCNASWPQMSWLEGKTLQSVIMKLSFLCTVYHIWIERNRRIFSKEHKPEEIIINMVIQMVRGRIISMNNITNSTGDNWYLVQWNLPSTIMKMPSANNAGRGLSVVKEAPTYMISSVIVYEFVSFCSVWIRIVMVLVQDPYTIRTWLLNKYFVRFVIDDRQESKLPVSYLGGPLISSKLSYLDCSLAGLLRGFRLELKKSGAKVAWIHLCLPRNEGGLGFKDVEIWNKVVVSKHICLLGTFGKPSNLRLNTLDRQVIFGLRDTSRCVLCEDDEETHYHLFFECSYSFRVWSSVTIKCNVNWPSLSWNHLVNWLATHLTGSSLAVTTCKLVFTCSIYCIWQERNCRIFQGTKSNEGAIINRIKELVRYKVLSISTFKADASNSWFLKEWSLPNFVLNLNCL